MAEGEGKSFENPTYDQDTLRDDNVDESIREAFYETECIFHLLAPILSV